MVYRFCKVLDALRTHGMVINSGKSAFLLRYRGSFIKAWLRRHLIHKEQGDCLRLRGPSGTVYEIPLKKQHTYLGIRISYHSQSRHTVAHRLQAAQHAWQRLKGILCSTRHLAQWHRIQLWKTTILPTLLYGIAASNPTDKDIKQLKNMATRQLRAITKSFAHMQHESTQKLLQRCHVPTIVEALHREATALHSGLLRLRAHANFTPDAQVEEARLLVVQLHLQVQQQWKLPTDGNPDDAAAYRCEACHRTFTSYRLLRAHEAKWHGKKTPQTLHSTFDRNAHGHNGLPTCRHCRHPFRQWDGLVKHIQRDRCQVLRKQTSKVSDTTACAKTEQTTMLVARTTENAVPSPPEGPPSPAISQVGGDSKGDASTYHMAPEAPCSSSTQVEPSVLPAEESPTDLPLMQWTSVQERLSNGRWTQLLQDDQVRDRCPVCYQWLATTTSIKYHLTMQQNKQVNVEATASPPIAMRESRVPLQRGNSGNQLRTTTGYEDNSLCRTQLKRKCRSDIARTDRKCRRAAKRRTQRQSYRKIKAQATDLANQLHLFAQEPTMHESSTNTLFFQRSVTSSQSNRVPTSDFQLEVLEPSFLRDMTVATLNCRGLSSISRRERVIHTMHKHNIDVLCLQETKINSNSKETHDGYTMYWSSGISDEKRNKAESVKRAVPHRRTPQQAALMRDAIEHLGVGIVISKRLGRYVKDIQQISARNICITLTMHAGDFDIISTYAPQACCSEPNASQKHYHELMEIVGAKSNTHPKLFLETLTPGS